MQRSPAWKFYLINDALPKFTAAVSACADTEDTSEIKATARMFIRTVHDLVFPNEELEYFNDPQEENKDSNQTVVIKKIIKGIKDLVELDKVFADKCIEEKKKLDAKKSELPKLVLQFGDLFDMDVEKISQKIESKKEKLQEHF